MSSAAWQLMTELVYEVGQKKQKIVLFPKIGRVKNLL